MYGIELSLYRIMSMRKYSAPRSASSVRTADKLSPTPPLPLPPSFVVRKFCLCLWESLILPSIYYLAFSLKKILPDLKLRQKHLKIPLNPYFPQKNKTAPTVECAGGAQISVRPWRVVVLSCMDFYHHKSCVFIEFQGEKTDRSLNVETYYIFFALPHPILHHLPDDEASNKYYKILHKPSSRDINPQSARYRRWARTLRRGLPIRDSV